jgi:acyl-coenzyme A synthetase/AMP-(fatty) acid ligase
MIAVEARGIGRVPDIIRAEDGTVYSLQTEEFLLKHFPEVADLSVVASQGGRFAEVTAIVRLKPESKAAEPELLKKFNEKLQAGGKVELDAVLFAKPTEIPLGPTGKVMKRELRDQKTHLAKTQGFPSGVSNPSWPSVGRVAFPIMAKPSSPIPLDVDMFPS